MQILFPKILKSIIKVTAFKKQFHLLKLKLIQE